MGFNPGFSFITTGGGCTSTGSNSNQAISIAGSGRNTLVSPTTADRCVVFATDGVVSNVSIYLVSASIANTTNWLIHSRANGVQGNIAITFPPNTSGYFEDVINSDPVQANTIWQMNIFRGHTPSVLVSIGTCTYKFTPNNNLPEYQYTGENETLNDVNSNNSAFLQWCGGNAGNPSRYDEDNVSMRMATSGIAKKMFVGFTTNPATQPFDVKSRKNGANGNQVITIPAATTGVFWENSNTDSYAPDDDLCIMHEGFVGPNTGRFIMSAGFSFLSDKRNYEILSTGPGFQSVPTTQSIAASLTGELALTAPASELQGALLFKDPTLLSNFRAYVKTSTSNRQRWLTLRVNQVNTSLNISLPTNTTGWFSDPNTVIVMPDDKVTTLFRGNTGGSGSTRLIKIGLVGTPLSFNDDFKFQAH